MGEAAGEKGAEGKANGDRPHANPEHRRRQAEHHHRHQRHPGKKDIEAAVGEGHAGGVVPIFR